MSKLKFLLAAATLATTALNGHTAVMYTDTVNPNPDITITSSSPYTFVHDITDNGYNPLTQTLLRALLTIHLIDNVSKGSETFKFDIGTGAFVQTYNGSNVPNGNGAVPYPVNLVASLGDLAADGKLSVTLTAAAGDYIFTHSTLTATAIDVPEPASLALMGLGLAALGLRRRKG